ncbi:MAG: hypothetical protein OSB58_20040 [Alphaproteobacteria bacterium]|jgi:hypothetical protein|nr:hypothetical protein [Alphaproteobacteria bacterium]
MKHLIFAFALLVSSIGIAQAEDTSKHATLYKTPQCGCCESYAEHLRDSGFKVIVKPSNDLDGINAKAGIDEGFAGCHTTFIDGYVVSGHVPINIVKRLLALRPDIKGVTLPGMPMGSPGMGGRKQGPFTVYEVNDGALKVYSKE